MTNRNIHQPLETENCAYKKKKKNITAPEVNPSRQRCRAEALSDHWIRGSWKAETANRSSHQSLKYLQCNEEEEEEEEEEERKREKGQGRKGSGHDSLQPHVTVTQAFVQKCQARYYVEKARRQ